MTIRSFEYWVEQLANRSLNTKRAYLAMFSKFVEFTGKTPDELIEVQKTGRNREGDLREKRVLETKVRGFLRHLEEKGYAINSRKLAYCAVRSFFQLNMYPLFMLPQDRPTGEAEGSRIPEKDEIVKMLNAAKSRRHRTAILVLKDSGLRISDVVRLEWEHRIDYGEGFWGWNIITKKRRIQATTFLGPESTEALRQLDRKHDRIFPVLSDGLSVSIARIARSAGLKGVSGHGLRKFYNVELQAARIPREWRYQMMGKKIGVYDENRVNKLLNAYRGAYNNLRVFGVSVTLEVGELQRSLEEVRLENQHLRERVRHLERKRKLQDEIMTLLSDPEVLKRLKGED